MVHPWISGRAQPSHNQKECVSLVEKGRKVGHKGENSSELILDL